MTETLYDGRRVRLLMMIDEGNPEGLEIVVDWCTEHSVAMHCLLAGKLTRK